MLGRLATIATSIFLNENMGLRIPDTVASEVAHDCFPYDIIIFIISLCQALNIVFDFYIYHDKHDGYNETRKVCSPFSFITC
jgi:hypothetical protein